MAIGFHRMPVAFVLPIDGCLIHETHRARRAAFRDGGEPSFGLKDVQNLLLTVEPSGTGLLWRLRFPGGNRVRGTSFAHRVAELLPESTLLDDSMRSSSGHDLSCPQRHIRPDETSARCSCSIARRGHACRDG